MTPVSGRDELLRRFETLLDAALAGEEPPAGLDAQILEAVRNEATDPSAAGRGDSRDCDSYALWAAMTALTQEIKLQGRAFEELSRTLPAQTAKIADELRAIYEERERTLRRETERRCRREVLSALIDLRDRLVRGRDAVGVREREIGNRKSWLPAIVTRTRARQEAAATALAALVRGYELGIERLDQTLEEFNAREIRCQGEAFDPRRMNAIDSEESATAAPDTVLEVYRSGYEWDGEVFRPAQVKVSRAPAGISRQNGADN